MKRGITLKIGLLHPLFEIAGGGEYLALNIIKALTEEGHDVTVLTVSSFDKDKFSKLYNIDIREAKVIRLKFKSVQVVEKFLGGRGVRLRRFLIYKYMFKYLKEELNHTFDLTFETQSNVPAPVDVSYIHFPAIYEMLNPEFRVNWLYEKIVGKFARDIMKLGRPRLVLTNSTWTSKIIKKVYNLNAEIIYPPVNTKYFSECFDQEKENLVITVSRFTPEKHLEAIIEVARKVKDYLFIIVGSTSRYSKPILKKLNNLIKEYTLSNVILKPNLPRAELKETLCRAKFYLHPPFPEHFGISVVEAMSAGAIPIVYKDGGAWTDIVSRIGVKRLGYANIEEVPKIIKSLEKENELRYKVIETAKNFDETRFREKIARIVEELER